MDKYKKTEYLLYNYKMLLISIENIKQDIELLKQECGVGSIDTEKDNVSKTYKFSSVVEDTALSKMEQIEYLEMRVRKMEGQIERIDRTLEGLTDEERAILVEKYIEGKQWWQVANKVRYGERYCRTIRTEAIKKMALGIFGERID